MPTAEVNGASLYYEEQGSGEPLLLIMGFSANLTMWAQQTPVLAQQYRVITFDNRGAGRSATPPGPYTIRQMADDAAALLDHLGIARAHIVGWSMGGGIAQELALSHPQKVDRLVLLATGARMKDATVAWLDFSVEAVMPMDTAGKVVYLLPWMFTPAFMTQLEMVEGAVQQLLADPFPPTPEGLAAQAAACRAWVGSDALLDRLPGITAPTLVLVGAEDILTPVAYAQELAEQIPAARLQVLDRGGHGVPVEYPEAVNDALLAFLAERQPAAATRS